MALTQSGGRELRRRDRAACTYQLSGLGQCLTAPAESTPAGSNPTKHDRLFVRAERWKDEVGVKSSGRKELEGTRINKAPPPPFFLCLTTSIFTPEVFFSCMERRHAT